MNADAPATQGVFNGIVFLKNAGKSAFEAGWQSHEGWKRLPRNPPFAGEE